MNLPPLALGTIICAAIAAVILLWFLIRRPKLLDPPTRTLLFFGMGVFPLMAAGSANIQGFEATKDRAFCGSCHVMSPHAKDSEDRHSTGLASRHARNPFFGEQNCYRCHADYGMFGTVVTKLGGMRHVYYYYTEYSDMPLAEAREKIKLLKPFPNSNCMECHSTQSQGWLGNPEHRSVLTDVRSGKVSCASPGCHGYAHPVTKPPITKLPAQLAIARDAGAPDIPLPTAEAGAPDAAVAAPGAQPEGGGK